MNAGTITVGFDQEVVDDLCRQIGDAIREAMHEALDESIKTPTSPAWSEDDGVVNVTVEDSYALHTLPFGTQIRDNDGDVFTKVGADSYLCSEGIYGARYNFNAEQLSESLPGVIVNPEVLGTFRPLAEVPVPDSEMLGAYVDTKEGFDALPAGSIVAPVGAEWDPCRKLTNDGLDVAWFSFGESTPRRVPGYGRGYIVTFVGTGAW